jgi:hypothetical protein
MIVVLRKDGRYVIRCDYYGTPAYRGSDFYWTRDAKYCQAFETRADAERHLNLEQ